MQSDMSNVPLKGVLITLGISCLLIISWVFPITRLFWDYLDALTYLWMHHFFLQTDFQQKFWAVMNSRIADHVSQAIFVLILVRYAFSDNAQFVRKRAGQVLFVLAAVITSVLISKTVQHQLSNHMSIKRDSPSIILGHEVALSEVLPGLDNVKDSSRRSFPGDHAMTLILLCGFIFCLTKKPGFRIVAVVTALFFVMPRLISGAHWLTDLIMGSFPIAIFALTLWLGVYSLFKNLTTAK